MYRSALNTNVTLPFCEDWAYIMSTFVVVVDYYYYYYCNVVVVVVVVCSGRV
jgi:hypothetical protein